MRAVLKTNNLHLLHGERFHLEAFSQGKNNLAALLQVSIPENWPQFPEAFALGDTREVNLLSKDWSGFFFIHFESKALVGNGGFTGSPDDSGTVEIGYETAPEYCQGFATEAAGALIDYAFTHAAQTVIAHTLAEKNASNSVLQKVGMEFVLELADAEQGKIWRWQIQKGDFQRLHYLVKPSGVF
jgi:[ribosomal protein S5]-alanine N-acetyltransferase